jgi:hypothetical protein
MEHRSAVQAVVEATAAAWPQNVMLGGALDMQGGRGLTLENDS